MARYSIEIIVETSIFETSNQLLKVNAIRVQLFSTGKNAFVGWKRTLLYKKGVVDPFPLADF